MLTFQRDGRHEMRGPLRRSALRWTPEPYLATLGVWGRAPVSKTSCGGRASRSVPPVLGARSERNEGTGGFHANFDATNPCPWACNATRGAAGLDSEAMGEGHSRMPAALRAYLAAPAGDRAVALAAVHA